MAKIFKCFDLVPSGPNATFTITLNADLPSNKDESIPFVIDGNPGHTFLTITKTNGTQAITQSFGFYPASAPKSLGLGNVDSKIVNDKNHEINASIMMNINEASFNLLKANAIYWATLDYNLESNNCADFGINLFNLARSTTPITTQPFFVYIPLPTAPYSLNATMNKSPQKLFSKLNEMKTTGHPEAGNIVINRTHGTESGLSQGECL